MEKITFIIIPEIDYVFYGLKLIKIQNKKYLGLVITWMWGREGSGTVRRKKHATNEVSLTIRWVDRMKTAQEVKMTVVCVL